MPVIDVFKYLCRRCWVLDDPVPGSPLVDLRNALCLIAGSMVERATAGNLQKFSRRRAHQQVSVPMFGKTGSRRCRRSSMDVMQALEVAEDAGHGEAIIRSSGSNWLAAASCRARTHLYKKKTEDAFGPGSFAAALCWDGLSVSGLNVQLGVARDFVVSPPYRHEQIEARRGPTFRHGNHKQIIKVVQ